MFANAPRAQGSTTVVCYKYVEAHVSQRVDFAAAFKLKVKTDFLCCSDFVITYLSSLKLYLPLR